MSYREEAGKTPEQIEHEIALQRTWRVYQEYRHSNFSITTHYLDVPGGRLWLYEIGGFGGTQNGKRTAMTFQPDVPASVTPEGP